MNAHYRIGLAILSLSLTACGKVPVAATVDSANTSQAPVGVPDSEGAVVHGRAIYTVSNEQENVIAQWIKNILVNSAYASSSGSTPITYTNAGSTTFSLNISGLTAGSRTANTLNLGSIALANLSDNDLKSCGSNSTTKCSQAVIRVYTTGSIAGFVNSVDGYGVPVYTGTLNPTTPLGLTSAGAVQVQTLSIPATKHTVSLADFPSPSYSISVDLSNAGAGSYSMTYVVEYALLQ